MYKVVTHSRRMMTRVKKIGLCGAREPRNSEWQCRVLELGIGLGLGLELGEMGIQ